ncbi:MAG: ABC transporter substrate-binding protein [Gammaproteobacteria bacterium]|nr:ABC transporter substrate-binding protein [Gammaproteobacteria bacterium]
MTAQRSLLAGLVLLLWAAGAARAAEPGPRAVVRETIDAVLGIARSEGASAARRDAAFAVVKRHFDFEAMSRRVLATHWAVASADARTRFVGLFAELLARTYWRRIANYRGGSVEFVAERVRDDGYATVATLVHTDTTAIPVDYRLQRTATGWQAYDVTIEQISLVRNYRGSFQDIVHKHGIAGLLQQMESRIAQLPAE